MRKSLLFFAQRITSLQSQLANGWSHKRIPFCLDVHADLLALILILNAPCVASIHKRGSANTGPWTPTTNRIAIHDSHESNSIPCWGAFHCTARNFRNQFNARCRHHQPNLCEALAVYKAIDHTAIFCGEIFALIAHIYSYYWRHIIHVWIHLVSGILVARH